MTAEQKSTEAKLTALDAGPEAVPWLEELAPRKIVAELDRYIVGQDEAKKSVAIAIRNRWRRQQAPDDIRDEILPNNIIMIGPTGVGKTEIARRLARLSGAPFLKIEASKFTEVGYVGRDVESMIRDLVDASINMVRGEREEEVFPQAEQRVEDRLVELLFPSPSPTPPAGPAPSPRESGLTEETRPLFVVSSGGEVTQQEGDEDDDEPPQERHRRTQDKLRTLLKDGKLEDREIEIEVVQQGFPILDLMQPQPGMDAPDVNLGEMLQDFLPKRVRRNARSRCRRPGGFSWMRS